MRTGIVDKPQVRLCLMVVLLFFIVLCVFGNTLLNGFVWDDADIIVGRSWDSAFSRFSAELNRDVRNVPLFFVSADTAFNEAAPYYRPLNRITYLVDYLLWGLRPAGYHLTSILLHATVVALLFATAYRRFGRSAAAFAAAALFAVHPANAEAVNFISGRNNILCAVFYLAALLSYLRFGQQGSSGSLIAGGLFTAASLLSKETAVTLPLVVLIFLPGEEKRRKLIAAALSLVLVVLYMVIRRAVLGSFGPDIIAGLGQRLISMPILLYEYLRLAIFPYHLDAFYDLPVFTASDYRFAVGMAGLAVAVILFLRLRGRALFRAGLLWAAACIILALNIVPIPSAAMAERYLYLPLMGMCLAAASLFERIHGTNHRAAITAVVVILALFSVRTVQRNTDWRSDETLYRSMIASNPANPFGRYNLGVTYLEQGRSDLAIAEFETLARIVPRSAKAHLALANACWKAGLKDRARDEWEKAVEVEPANLEALRQLASFHRFFGDPQRARVLFVAILSISPEDAVAREALQEIDRDKQGG